MIGWGRFGSGGVFTARVSLSHKLENLPIPLMGNH